MRAHSCVLSATAAAMGIDDTAARPPSTAARGAEPCAASGAADAAARAPKRAKGDPSTTDATAHLRLPWWMHGALSGRDSRLDALLAMPLHSMTMVNAVLDTVLDVVGRLCVWRRRRWVSWMPRMDANTCMHAAVAVGGVHTRCAGATRRRFCVTATRGSG